MIARTTSQTADQLGYWRSERDALLAALAGDKVSGVWRAIMERDLAKAERMIARLEEGQTLPA